MHIISGVTLHECEYWFRKYFKTGSFSWHSLCKRKQDDINYRMIFPESLIFLFYFISYVIIAVFLYYFIMFACCHCNYCRNIIFPGFGYYCKGFSYGIRYAWRNTVIQRVSYVRVGTTSILKHIKSTVHLYLHYSDAKCLIVYFIITKFTGGLFRKISLFYICFCLIGSGTWIGISLSQNIISRWQEISTYNRESV